MYFNVFGEKISRRRYKEMCQAAKNRRELIAAGLTSRRDLMKPAAMRSLRFMAGAPGKSTCTISPGLSRIDWGAAAASAKGKVGSVVLQPTLDASRLAIKTRAKIEAFRRPIP